MRKHSLEEMEMTRRFLLLGLLGVVALSAAPARAHDDYRIVGTITKVQGKQLAVKNKDSKTFSIGMNDLTLVKRDKTKTTAAELKPGLSVVVDARGDSEKDLMAVEIRIVPAIAATATKK